MFALQDLKAGTVVCAAPPVVAHPPHGCDDACHNCLRSLPASPSIAVATANKNMRHVVAIVNYAVEEEILPRLPRIRRIKEPKKRRVRSWTVAEVSRMLAAAAVLLGAMLALAALTGALAFLAWLIAQAA